MTIEQSLMRSGKTEGGLINITHKESASTKWFLTALGPILRGAQDADRQRKRYMQVNSHKLNHLLPDKRQVEYDLRPVNAYPLPQTRTDRYRNSIIPWGLFH